jgi:hypothetical protein
MNPAYISSPDDSYVDFVHRIYELRIMFDVAR